MGHHHSHEGHAHDHSVKLTDVNSAFVAGIVLNVLFVIAEVVAGLRMDSVSLLSDAGHNLADVGTLALSLLAFRLLKVKSNKHYTYGYRKTSILVTLFNGMVLMISIGAIVYEAVHRLLKPEPVQGLAIAIVAGIGIVINGATALLFMRNKEKDLNVKSAYLHMLSDALVSFGIVVGGIIIIYTGWYWLDSVLGIVIAIFIFISTWGLLKDSLRLSLDGVPADISLDEIKGAAMKIAGVTDFHHVHVWAISTTENALTAHLVLPADSTMETEHLIKEKIRHELLHMNIQHATIETEKEDIGCAVLPCT